MYEHCLLMPDPAHWYYDARHEHDTVFDVVPLDHPRLSLDNPQHTLDLPFMRKRFWVGMNCDWITTVDGPGTWFLANMYTRRVIELPSSANCEMWHDERAPPIGHPDIYVAGYFVDLKLLKIVICKVPITTGHFRDYKLIALFNQGLAYLDDCRAWRFLRLRIGWYAARYSDAIEHCGIIFAVDGGDGSMYC